MKNEGTYTHYVLDLDYTVMAYNTCTVLSPAKIEGVLGRYMYILGGASVHIKGFDSTPITHQSNEGIWGHLLSILERTPMYSYVWYLPSTLKFSRMGMIRAGSDPSALSNCHTQNCSNESHCKLAAEIKQINQILRKLRKITNSLMLK